MRFQVIRALLVAILGIAATAGSSFAQGTMIDVRVRLDAGQNTPITGALVAIVDGDRVISEGLSSQRGTITLRAAPGTYRIRVRRIGYRPFLSDPVTLRANNELVLHVDTDRVVLDAMVISASAQCGAITKDAQTLSAVWDEITKALRASQLTLNDLGGMGRMLMYKRELGIHGEVISSDTTTLPITNLRPFGVSDLPSLTERGYVRGDPQAGWEYFGPDETVLLSDAFAATHCFKVVRDRKKRPGQIGVAFEPAPKRKLSDIKGVLWVDEKTAELRDVGFVYVNAGLLTNFEPGGFTKFRRVHSGAWIVSEWQLRMPKLVARRGTNESIDVDGYIENGGRIMAADTNPKQERRARSSATDSTRKK